MEKVQAKLAELRIQMATQMTQFMEAITNSNRRQDEFTALVNNQVRNRADAENQGLFADVYVGLDNVQDQDFVNPHGPQGNPFDLRRANQGQFPPPPGSQLVGNRRGNPIIVRGNQERDHDFEQEEDGFSMHSDLYFPIQDRRYRQLEERLKVVEGEGIFGMDANDLGLVSGVRVPPKFKPPVFEKYNGSSCPVTHATAYFWKMSVHTHDQGLLIH